MVNIFPVMRDAKKNPKMITLKNDRLSYGIVSIGMKLFFSQLYLKLVLGYIVLWPVFLVPERKRKL